MNRSENSLRAISGCLLPDFGGREPTENRKEKIRAHISVRNAQIAIPKYDSRTLECATSYKTPTIQRTSQKNHCNLINQPQTSKQVDDPAAADVILLDCQYGTINESVHDIVVMYSSSNSARVSVVP